LLVVSDVDFNPEIDMRPEYDFSRGVRGKYIERLALGTNVVALDADVAAIFPDSQSVNAALRKAAGLPPRKKSKRRGS
jgi:hypothetical protein